MGRIGTWLDARHNRALRARDRMECKAAPRIFGRLQVGLFAPEWKGAIRIGEGVVILPFPRDKDIDHDTWYVRDGIVVVPKDAEIPSGTRIAPDESGI